MQVSRHTPLREVLTVSSRGQITLLAEMRRQLGIEPGGAVIVEVFGNELCLKPAAVLVWWWSCSVMRSSLNGNRLMPFQTKNASKFSSACKRLRDFLAALGPRTEA